MWTLLAILAWLAAALLAVLAAALVTPVRLRARLGAAPGLTYRLDASAFGGLAPPVPIIDSARAPKARKAKPRKARRKPERAPAARVGRMASAAPGALGGLLRAIRLEHLALDVEFGLGDPADTGQLHGLLSPLRHGVPWPGWASLSLRPNFERACLAGVLEARLSVTPAALLPPAARLAWAVFGPGR